MPDWNPLLFINGIECNLFTGAEGEDVIREHTSPENGFAATVKIKCRWEDRHDLRAALLGTVDYLQGNITRTAPFPYPLATRDNAVNERMKIIPGRTFCTGISDTYGIHWSSDPEGTYTGQRGWGQYTFAVLVCEFTTERYLIEPLAVATEANAFNDLTNQPYCISELRTSGEVFSPPTGAFVWQEGQKQGQSLKDADIGLIFPRVELSVTRKRMPLVPMIVLDSLIGTVNQDVFQVGDHAFGSGSALFMGWNPRPYADPYNGGIVYDIEMLWLINGQVFNANHPNADRDWNWYLDTTGSWSLIGRNIDANPQPPPFVYADHTQLFGDTIS